MRSIIKDGAIVEDNWRLVRPDEAGVLPQVPTNTDVIVPLSAWRSADWRQRTGRTAVWLAPDEDPGLLVSDLDVLPLIAVDFPSFTDGRGYSIGRLLRERYGFSGEMRAVGDVWKDVLHYLWQVGFDAFELKPGKEIALHMQGLQDFSERYHSTWREPEPLFRRRSKTGA